MEIEDLGSKQQSIKKILMYWNNISKKGLENVFQANGQELEWIDFKSDWKMIVRPLSNQRDKAIYFKLMNYLFGSN